MFKRFYLFLPILCGLLTSSSYAQGSFSEGLTTTTTLLAHAQPDECFEGIGQNTLGVTPPCSEGAIAKVNQAYVWGMALANDRVFFGTVANTHCLVIGTFLQSIDPILNDAYACEFGSTPVPGVPPELGDFRPPSLYMYDTQTAELTDLEGSMTPQGRALLSSTVGIRAAGAHNGVVLFGGLSLGGGINFFAFADDGTFITSATEAGYSNIRKFRVIEDALYAGVGFDDGGTQEGHVLKWIGDLNDPIDFETVGVVGSEVAELTGHEGRIFVTTWPDDDALAGLYMSPLLGVDGSLEAENANGWVDVFSVSDYESNPISATTYGLGALASFDGWLFWGTMHVPGTGSAAHRMALDEGIGFDLEDSLLAERSISIFRGRNFDSTPELDVLYGYPEMWVMDVTTGNWTTEPNGLDQIPLFGAPGFNNLLNNYTWTMEVYDNRLWIGTMDVGGLIAFGSGLLTEVLGGIEQALLDVVSAAVIGADLWFFVDAELPALPEMMGGAGNPANYGFRTMASDGDRLFIGTANPMNLLTGATTRASGIGGWELLAIDARPPNTPVGDQVQVELGNGMMVEFCSVSEEGITGMAMFGATEAEATLLDALNAELSGLDEGAVVINSTYTVATSALWSSEGACASDGMTIHLTFDEPLYNARLVLVSFDPISGSPIIEELDGQTWPLGDQPNVYGFSSGVSADISQNPVGFIVLLSERPPVPVPSTMWLALLLMAGLLWASARQLRRV